MVFEVTRSNRSPVFIDPFKYCTGAVTLFVVGDGLVYFQQLIVLNLFHMYVSVCSPFGRILHSKVANGKVHSLAEGLIFSTFSVPLFLSLALSFPQIISLVSVVSCNWSQTGGPDGLLKSHTATSASSSSLLRLCGGTHTSFSQVCNPCCAMCTAADLTVVM